MKYELAVVFGTYNRLDFLNKAVESIRKSTMTLAYRIVVIDGGSTDSTLAWLSHQPDITVIKQEGPLTGAVRAFNRGFAWAVENEVPFVAHLNDDAELLSFDAFTSAIKQLKADPSIGEIAFAYDLYRTDFRFDTVNGKPYANYGVIRTTAGIQVAKAQGDPSGKKWWNPIYKTYGADCEFGVWLWKLGWKVVGDKTLRIHDAECNDDLRKRNDAKNPDRLDSALFWARWGDDPLEDTKPPAPRPWRGLDQKVQVLITGGTGFLGRHIQHELGVHYPHANVIPVNSNDYDLTVPERAQLLLAKHRPDLIIHAAARVGGIGANVSDSLTFFNDNLRMGINVLEAAKLFRTPKVLLVGTTCSYPDNLTPPFRENDMWLGFPESTNSAYGIAKRTISFLGDTYRSSGMNVITVIPANLYGPGDSTDLERSHVIPALCRKFLEAKRLGHPKVHLWGDGSPTRDFLYAKDAAYGIVLAAHTYNQAKPINLGTGIETSITRVAALVAGFVGYKGEIVWDKTKPNGQKRRCLDVTYAYSAIKFTATTGLAEGIQETLKSMK